MNKHSGKLVWLALWIIISTTANAQVPMSVRGTVRDKDGIGLKYVTISLLRTADSSLVKAGLSDDNGLFEIAPAVPGHFLLRFSATGFITTFSPPISIMEGQTVQAAPQYMEIASKALQDVTVVAKKQMIQVKTDRTVFNIEGSINASGSNALELLQKSPGVTVDNNDNISMKGKAGVRVSIDGKILPLGPEDLANYLKSISSNDIEAIEMIHNPGARYDASGNAGIINIRLRKSSARGTHVSITAGMVQGITPKANGDLNLNFRNQKVNIFSHVGASVGRYETSIVAPRVQKDTLYDQELWQLSNNHQFNIKAGADYFINSKHTVGVMVHSNFSEDDWISYGRTGIYYEPAHAYVKNLIATNAIPRRRSHINSNLNYRYADTSGREINFDADYGTYRGRAKSYQPNTYLDADGNLLSEVITRNSTPTDIDIYTVKADILLPVRKNKLGFGAKLSKVETDNTLDFYLEQGGATNKVPERSYNFIYKENVYAAYISYDWHINNAWNLQAGLRAEQTESEGILARGDGVIQGDHQVKRSYFDLFPNLLVNWTINSLNRLHLSYGRRIDRPNYQTLNPFEIKLDELSYVKGNSFLRPQYSNNAEAGYTWKNKITFTAGYSHVKDFATQTVDTLNNYTYAMAKNLATQQIVSFSISSPLTIRNWWNGFVNIWCNYQEFDGKINEEPVQLQTRGYGAFLQQSFNLGHDYSAEVSGWFNGPSPLGPTLVAKAIGGMDLGFQKLLLKKKATLKISFTDVFRSAVPFRAKTDFGGLLLRFWVTRESQTVRASFTIRFGNSKIKAARQRQLGLETESGRIREN